jgi:hypothetical protein
MKLNWKAAAQTGLSALGGQVSNNYENMQKEQMLMRAEDRRYQTDMAKTKEIGKMKTERVAKAKEDRRANLPEGMDPNSFAGRSYIDNGTIVETEDEKIRSKSALLDLGIDKSAEQAQGIEDKNMATYKEYADKAETDQNGNPIFSDADRIEMGIRGLKIPKEVRKPLSMEAKAKLHQGYQKMSNDKWTSEEITPAQRVNRAKDLLKANKKPVPTNMSDEQALNVITGFEANQKYATTLYFIGGSSGENMTMPNGDKIPEKKVKDIKKTDTGSATALVGDPKAAAQRVAQAEAMGEQPDPKDLERLKAVPGLLKRLNIGQHEQTTPESREAGRVEAQRLHNQRGN